MRRARGAGFALLAAASALTIEHAGADDRPPAASTQLASTPLAFADLPGVADDDLAAALQSKVRRPFVMDWSSDHRNVHVRVQLPDAVLELEAPFFFIYTSTI